MNLKSKTALIGTAGAVALVLISSYALLSNIDAGGGNLRQAVISLTLVWLVIVPCLVWAFAWYLMRPLAVLHGAIQALLENPDGNPDANFDANVQAPANSRNEFGALATSFNQLIHARRDIETKLRESEARYRELFQNMTTGFVLHEMICDARGTPFDFRFVEVNPAFTILTGFSADTVRGKTIRELMGDAENAFIKTCGQVVKTGTPLTIRNYSPHLYKYFDTLAFSPQKNHLALIFSDVTERVSSEQKLRHLSQAVEQSPVSISITDLQGKIEYVNPKFSQLTGYSFHEAIGQTHRIVKSGYTSADEYAELWRTISSGGLWSGEFQNKKKSGALYWEQVRILPIVSESGVITHFLSVKEDVTERKRIENELFELNRSLEQRVAQRTTELKELNAELESFSYSVSHDLRAPLRAIDGYSKIIADQCANKLTPDELRLIDRMRVNTQRMGHLIDDLLNLARVARAEIKHQEVSLSDLASEIMASLNESDPARKVKWRIAPSANCAGDVDLLRIVLENLLGNAWKYSRNCPVSTIEFGIRDAEEEVYEQAQRVYFVRDNGAGFDMVYASNLFGAFQRMHALSEFEGTGIGLASAKRILTRHGGKIWAKSAPNEGATFFFSLP